MLVALLGVAALIYWYKCDFASPSCMRDQLIAPRQPGAAFPNSQKLPLILNDDRLEKSFTAQKQENVRLPFGPPNAFQYTIETPAMLMSNPEYPKAYQKNIRNVSGIGTEDWRIDPKFNSPFNNYASMHMPENCLKSISKWGY